MNSRTQNLVNFTKSFVNMQWLLIALWLMTMIALPILRWELGNEVVPAAVVVALVTKCLAVMVILVNAIGFAKAFRAFLVVSVLTWTAEYVGSHTGIPFGAYSYTESLQPQLGHVPMIIPLAWFAMLPACWVIAQIFTDRSPIAYSLVGAIAMTAWDLFLDPQMVGWGFWIWHDEGHYFGIPWTNYAGWLLIAFLVTLVVRPFRFRLPVSSLLAIYGIVWFLQTIGQALFWGQPGPALVGGMVMGTILVISIAQFRRERVAHGTA